VWVQRSVMNELPLDEIAEGVVGELLADARTGLQDELEQQLLRVLREHVNVTEGSDPDELSGQVATVLKSALPQLTEIMVASLDQRAHDALVDNQASRAAFETRLAGRWGRALDLTEQLWIAAHEAGAEFNARNRPQAAQEQDVAFEVLTRLHARGCQIASEVLALLRSGHADGAMARWRSLHETAVVALFIHRHGGDVANRYLLHEVVESARGAREYNEHAAVLGLDPIDEDELTAMAKERDALVERFGAAFAGPYGWAADVVAPNRATLAAIERHAGLEHLRPYYRLASHGVHANPKAAMFRLGLRPGENLLLAGPSNAGLADPGHATCISLNQLTVALLMHKVSLSNVLLASALAVIVDRAGDAYLEAHQEIEGDQDLIDEVTLEDGDPPSDVSGEPTGSV
jgi:hypothetical protein